MIAHRGWIVLTLSVALLDWSGCSKEEPAPTSNPPPSASRTQPPPAREAGQAELPPGHPPITPTEGTGAKDGAPADASDIQSQLPPGHPPIGDLPAAAQPPAGSAAVQEGQLVAGGIRFDVPEGWVSEQPASSMRAAQFRLAGDAGPVELAVFPGIGGGVQANIDRWVAQFSDPANPDGKAQSRTETFEQAGLKVTIVRASGTLAPTQMTPNAPTTPQEGAGLYGIIVEGGPAGVLFIKGTGPAATIEAHAEALAKFARSAVPAAEAPTADSEEGPGE